MHRAARVRDRDPGRRRDPADRRGARRRRRGLPAEVLRGVLPPQARRPHDRLRHARHVRRRALLRPRDADRARRDGRSSATRARSAAPTTSSTSATCPTRRPRRSARRAAARSIAEAWFEEPSGERIAERQPGGALTRVLRGAFRGGGRRPGLRRHAAQRARTHDRRRAQRPARAHPGSFAAGETVSSRASSCPSWLTPSRYTLTPSHRARRAPATNALALRRGPGLDRDSRDSSGGILELPIDVRIERS